LWLSRYVFEDAILDFLYPDKLRDQFLMMSAPDHFEIISIEKTAEICL